MKDYNRAMAIRLAQWLYQTMTDYRFYSKVGLTWEEYQHRLQLEKDRYRARLYEISIGIL